MIAALAITLAGMFAGIAIYVFVVEHPARLGLEDRAALRQWKPSYHRGAIMQSSLAILSGGLGLFLFWKSADAWWLIGALAVLANWPFTLIAIMPTNRALKATDPDRTNAETRAQLIAWGRFHAVRTALGIASLLAYFAALD